MGNNEQVSFSEYGIQSGLTSSCRHVLANLKTTNRNVSPSVLRVFKFDYHVIFWDGIIPIIRPMTTSTSPMGKASCPRKRKKHNQKATENLAGWKWETTRFGNPTRRQRVVWVRLVAQDPFWKLRLNDDIHNTREEKKIETAEYETKMKQTI